MKKAGHKECITTLQPIRDALEVISGKWKVQIIISLSNGNDRFKSIQDSIPGMTPKVLAKELKDLELNNLIERLVEDTYPVSIRYRCAPYANSLTPVIDALWNWGTSHRKHIAGK